MKKALASVLVLLFVLALFPMSALAETKETINSYRYVETVYPKKGEHCYLRSSRSSTEDNILAKIKNGEKVYVYTVYHGSNSKKDWAYVKYNGQKGYMWAQNLTSIKPEEETPDFIGTYTVDSVYPHIMTYSFLRSSTNSAGDNRLATIKNGEQVDLYEGFVLKSGRSEEETWAYVCYKGTYGYMWAKNLSGLDVYNLPTPDGQPTPEFIGYYIVDSVYPRVMGYSFLRSSCSDLEENAICTLKNGTEVELYDGFVNKTGKPEKTWAYVCYNGSFGYMWAQNLEGLDVEDLPSGSGSTGGGNSSGGSAYDPLTGTYYGVIKKNDWTSTKSGLIVNVAVKDIITYTDQEVKALKVGKKMALPDGADISSFSITMLKYSGDNYLSIGRGYFLTRDDKYSTVWALYRDSIDTPCYRTVRTAHVLVPSDCDIRDCDGKNGAKGVSSSVTKFFKDHAAIYTEHDVTFKAKNGVVSKLEFPYHP